MKKNLLKSKYIFIMALCVVTGLYLNSCKKTIYPSIVNGGFNITGYIENDPADFSLFDQMLQKAGYDGFLGAYSPAGGYTVFVPTNPAITAYLSSIGVSSVSNMSVGAVRAFLRYHIIEGDTISTPNFIDGKIRTAPLDSISLISGISTANGVSSYRINNIANITTSNVICGNGVIQVIDHVLLPPTYTLYQYISNNPKYTIFTAALQATGFKDTLNTPANNNPNVNRNFFTVFAVSDSVYNTLGIYNVGELEAQYSTSFAMYLHNPSDPFYAYVAYHIIPENSYTTDILSKTSHITLSPTLDVISDVLLGTTVQLDYDLINGVQYPGAAIDKPNSNITTTNGVFHTLLGDIFIKIFPPTRVDWDLADQPEFRAQSSIFRVAGKASLGLNSPMKNIVWSNPGVANTSISYVCEAANNGSYFWWNDVLQMNNFRNTASQLYDAQFTTPIIIKGKYKVWFMYQRGSENTGCEFLFDGVPLQNVIPNMNTTYIPNSTDSGPVLESKGFKRYTEAPYGTGTSQYNVTYGFYCGVVNVTTTSTHIFETLAINGANANYSSFDMVQFIPADQDQENPRYFRRSGAITFQ